jgi:hypothetical protein
VTEKIIDGIIILKSISTLYIGISIYERPSSKDMETFSNLVKKFIFEFINSVRHYFPIINDYRDL